MSANEFVTLCQQAEIKLDVKTLYQIWNLSIEDQVDEILSDRHVRMNYPEFLEAVCRVADQINIADVSKFLSEGDLSTNLSTREASIRFDLG